MHKDSGVIFDFHGVLIDHNQPTQLTKLIHRLRGIEDPKYRLRDGAEELLDYIKFLGLPMAIATASDANHIFYWYHQLKLSRWVPREHVVYDATGQYGYDKTQAFIEAANRMSVHPEQCILFEDSLPQIEAAYKLGINRIIRVIDAWSDRGTVIPGLIQLVYDFTEIDKDRLFLASGPEAAGEPENSPHEHPSVHQ